MCGILGICGSADVAHDLAFGLTALQHRGQDAAGAVTFDGTFHMHKGCGLVGQVLREGELARLGGSSGIGHVRYATMGTTDVLDSQPVALNYPFGLAMAHNGNVINFGELRTSLCEDHHRLIDTSNDVALILYSFAAELETKNLNALSVSDVFDTVEATQRRVRGAYSAIALIANHGFLAFTDPYGFRPLVMGRRASHDGICYALASETTCLDSLGYESLGDLAPGEAVFIDRDLEIHRRIGYQSGRAFCVFEYIYFAREDSIIHGRLVANERVRMGRVLAGTFRKTGLRPEIVIDVPSSAYFFASGLAEALDIPYRRGLAKNHHIGRSFIAPSQAQRERLVRQKLNPIRDVVCGRRIAVVDDSIVRGTTSKRLVDLLRAAGAAEIYVVSASPPVRYPCIYGIDMSSPRELIADRYEPDEIARWIGADAVVYQRLDDLVGLYEDLPCCFACFSGEYPGGVAPGLLEEIEREKTGSGRA